MTDKAPTEAQIAHQQLIDELDIHSIPKNFRNASWKPNQRRNKNIKTILGDAQRKEAAALAAANEKNSSAPDTPAAAESTNGDDSAGPDTPAGRNKNGGLSTSGTSTPADPASADPPNLAQASRSLSKLVLEKNLHGNTAAGTSTPASAPSATYTNIESAPSLAHTKRYCDITGLPAPYLDPKSRLRYHDKEIFTFIRALPQGGHEPYLEARGAHTVLK